MDMQAGQLIRLCGRLYDTTDENEIVTIIACWVHQPLINDNLFLITEEKSKMLI